MTRNEIMKALAPLKRLAIDRANKNDTSDDWALVGEIERFDNDLCNVPCKHNTERRAITYTIKMAVKKLAELRRKL